MQEAKHAYKFFYSRGIQYTFVIGYFDQCSIISGLVSTRVPHVEQMEHETLPLRGEKNVQCT